MPYIPLEKREELDPKIDELIEVLRAKSFADSAMNYTLTRLVLAAFWQNPRYATINYLMGTLECVKAEFYRRHAAPYEDEKIKENGDVT